MLILLRQEKETVLWSAKVSCYEIEEIREYFDLNILIPVSCASNLNLSIRMTSSLLKTRLWYCGGSWKFSLGAEQQCSIGFWEVPWAAEAYITKPDRILDCRLS